MNPSVTHANIHFSGHVQGVGFRFSALQVAKGYEVNGYVQNLADGRVQLEAEGKESEVKAFLAAVEEELDSYIRDVEVSWAVRPPEFRGFSIAR